MLYSGNSSTILSVDVSILFCILTAMKYETLIDLLRDQGCFDFAALVQLTGEKRSSLRVLLHRWCKEGKLHALRRGMYALPDRYMRRPLAPPEVANSIYTPSYLSTHWALGYYGMVPEYVPQLTSVTRRKPARFENDFGVFVYRNIKATAFFGFRLIDTGAASIRVADPEKALLDLWHLERGKWDRSRMLAMRFQNTEMADPDRLLQFADRFESPRVTAAAQLWIELREEEQEGEEL